MTPNTDALREARAELAGLIAEANRATLKSEVTQVGVKFLALCFEHGAELDALARLTPAEAAPQGVEDGRKKILCPETMCAMWTTPQRTPSEDAAFIEGARHALAALSSTGGSAPDARDTARLDWLMVLLGWDGHDESLREAIDAATQAERTGAERQETQS